MMGKVFLAEGTANASAGMNSAKQNVSEKASDVREESQGEKVSEATFEESAVSCAQWISSTL